MLFFGGKGIYAWKSGTWRESLTWDNPARISTASDGTNAYVYSGRGSKNPCLLVSADSGGTWVGENVALDDIPYSFAPKSVYTIAASGGDLYLSGEITVGSDGEPIIYDAVVKRTSAPAGQGRYELVFMAPYGPNFATVRNMVFGTSTGYLLGGQTSVYFSGTDWLLETAPDWWAPVENTACRNSSGFWVVSENTETHRYGLYLAFPK